VLYPAFQAPVEGEEGDEDEEEKVEDEGKPGKIVKNEFNYNIRCSQTLNYPMVAHEAMTDPPPTATFSASVQQGVIFDTYVFMSDRR
jgi:hypothetical protein